MGMTFVIDSLEEMCDLMCDNKIPRREARKDAIPACCGECEMFDRGRDGERPLGTCKETGERMSLIYSWAVRGKMCPIKESKDA